MKREPSLRIREKRHVNHEHDNPTKMRNLSVRRLIPGAFFGRSFCSALYVLQSCLELPCQRCFDFYGLLVPSQQPGPVMDL